MSEVTRIQRNCLACAHPELLVGAPFHRGAKLFRLAGWWWSYFNPLEAVALICPNCGHIEMVLKTEALSRLKSKIGFDTKKPS